MLLQYAKKYSKLIAGQLLFATVWVLSQLAIPRLMVDIVDYGIMAGDMNEIVSRGMLMLLATVVNIVSLLISIYFLTRVTAGIARDLRGDLFNRIIGWSKETRGGGMGGMMWIILLFLIMMMLFMRPRQDKEGDKFRNSLQRDQDVITSSGIFGKVKEVDDVSVTIEIAQGMKIKVDKRYVNPIPTAQPVKPEREKLFGRKKKDPSKDEKA
jgi:preprotein translocase YajC subunit